MKIFKRVLILILTAVMMLSLWLPVEGANGPYVYGIIKAVDNEHFKVKFVLDKPAYNVDMPFDPNNWPFLVNDTVPNPVKAVEFVSSSVAILSLTNEVNRDNYLLRLYAKDEILCNNYRIAGSSTTNVIYREKGVISEIYDGDNTFTYTLVNTEFISEAVASDINNWTITKDGQNTGGEKLVGATVKTVGRVATFTLPSGVKFAYGDKFLISPKRNNLEPSANLPNEFIVTVQKSALQLPADALFTATGEELYSDEIILNIKDPAKLDKAAAEIPSNWKFVGRDGASLGNVTRAAVLPDKTKVFLVVSNAPMGVNQDYKVSASSAVFSNNVGHDVCVPVKIANAQRAEGMIGDNVIRLCYPKALSEASIAKFCDAKNWNFDSWADKDLGKVKSVKLISKNVDKPLIFEFVAEGVPKKNCKYYVDDNDNKLGEYVGAKIFLLDEGSRKPSDPTKDYNEAAIIAPVYSIKSYQKLPNGVDGTATLTSTKASDITVWSGGGTEKVGTQKVDHKTELVLPAVLAGNQYIYTDKATKKVTSVTAAADIDMDVNWQKSTGKGQGKQFKWFVTDNSVTSPMTAYLSKPAQTIGKDIATCTSGKLTASNKVIFPTIGKLWVFDESGQYGVCQFRVEVPPAAVYVGKDLSKAVYVNGKPDADTKKNIITSKCDMGIGEELTLKTSGQLTVKETLENKGLIALSDDKHGAAYYTYVVSGAEEVVGATKNGVNDGKGYLTVTIDDGSVKIKANKLKDNKATTAKFDIVCQQSQKKTSVTVNIKNPIVGMDFVKDTFTPTVQTAKKDTLIKVDAKPIFANPTINGITDKIDCYVVEGSPTDATKATLIAGLFDSNGKYKKQSGNPTYKCDGGTVKMKNKLATEFEVKIPKDKKSKYTLMVVCNTNKIDGGYPGIIFHDIVIPQIPYYTFETPPAELIVKNAKDVITSATRILGTAAVTLNVTATSEGKYIWYTNGGATNELTFTAADVTNKTVKDVILPITKEDKLVTFQKAVVYATLSDTSTIKGRTFTKGDFANSIGQIKTPGSVTLTAAQAADITGKTDFVTSFQSTEAKATIKAVKYDSIGNPAYFDTDVKYVDTEAITNGDFFIIRVTSQSGTIINYYKVKVIVK